MNKWIQLSVCIFQTTSKSVIDTACTCIWSYFVKNLEFQSHFNVPMLPTYLFLIFNQHELITVGPAEQYLVSCPYLQRAKNIREKASSSFFINLMLLLADKPPPEELHQFLEFQLPRQWAPLFGDLPLGPQRKQYGNASLQFSFMGPKLYINTLPVSSLSHYWSNVSKWTLPYRQKSVPVP